MELSSRVIFGRDIFTAGMDHTEKWCHFRVEMDYLNTFQTITETIILCMVCLFYCS